MIVPMRTDDHYVKNPAALRVNLLIVRKSLVLTCIFLFSATCIYAQPEKLAGGTIEIPEQELPSILLGQRIGVILGVGPSVLTRRVYADPIIDRSTNAVILEKTSRLRGNLSFGLSYTPKRRAYLSVEEDNGVYKNKYSLEPHGFSFALFVNPLGLNSSGNVALARSVDFGIGIGKRWGPLSIYVTGEMYTLRQPRQYFIDRYRDSNAIYSIAGEIQSSIDLADNTIFTNNQFVAVGMKVAFSFGVIRSFIQEINNAGEQKELEKRIKKNIKEEGSDRLRMRWHIDASEDK